MLSVNNVSYGYDAHTVLDSINLEVEEGEIICLLGESGSGKTTLLRVIAGLETGYSGEVIVDGQKMESVPIHQRGFGLMFQDFALFPHMTVAQNVAFGLRMQGLPKNEQNRIVSEMLELVGLDGYGNRSIDALSGGQKQRVALARSLAPRPKLLMLDEPLGSLDAGLRERLVIELRDIIKQIGLTAIYVTHDQQEAYAIADRIAVMNHGKIEQFDRPQALYQRPETAFVARFLGLNNIIPAEFMRDYVQLEPSADHYLIHPQSLVFDDNGNLAGKITGILFQGDRYRIEISADKGIDLTTYLSTTKNVPQIGDSVTLRIEKDDLHPLIR